MGKKEIRYDSIADVGPIALAIVNNPAREDALEWLNKVLKGEIKCVIPLSTIIGAFIVAVHYLGAKPREVAQRLELLVGVGKALWYADIDIDRVKESMRIAAMYSMDSWDAYLVSIMRDLGLHIVYTVDVDDFIEVENIQAVNPISEEKFRELQEWLKSKSK